MAKNAESVSEPQSERPEKLPDLRDFIKDHDQRLYDFCHYMLYGSLSVDDLVLDIFRDFGDTYRKTMRRSEGAGTDLREARVRLFQVAWEHVQKNLLAVQFNWTVGRDTRPLKSMDEDLISAWNGKEKNSTRVEEGATERLAKVDADLRAPVVLRDILKFEDEDVVRILGIRWGVYRHRLHRGRLEFRDCLRGKPTRLELTKSASA